MLAGSVDEKRSLSDKSHLVKHLILSSSVGATVYFALDLAGIVLTFFLLLQMLGKSAFDLDIALTIVRDFPGIFPCAFSCPDNNVPWLGLLHAFRSRGTFRELGKGAL